MTKEMIVVENFYKDPELVIAYAKTLQYYDPYTIRDTQYTAGPVTDSSLWMSSQSLRAEDCPFKSSESLIMKLETLTGECIDRDFWRAEPRAIASQSDGAGVGEGPRWNCAFHVKRNRSKPGAGVHNHVTDTWNAVGKDGWAGIVYLSKTAPIDAGLYLWQHKRGKDYQWGGDESDWQLTDSFGNFFNRLVLVRGKYPHSGGSGWGQGIDDGRFFQTFFFRTKTVESESVELILSSGV